jgi:hypothetical protein
MAAPAHVITVGLGPDMSQVVRAWFQQFNFLPPIPLTAGKIESINGADASFIKLLNVIAASPFNNFILVIHGADDGSGLWLKLLPQQRKPGTSHFDLQRLLELSETGGEMSSKDESIMGITQAESLLVREALLKIQFKTIETIEFRSCNLGRNPLSLDRFRRFFGARVAGAPNVHTFFGNGVPLVAPNFELAHRRLHVGANWETYNFPSAYKTPELVCCLQLNNLQKPETAGHVATDTADRITAWIQQYFMPTGSYSKGSLALHSLWVADRPAPPLPQDRLIPRAKPGPRMVPTVIEFDHDQTDSPLGGWGDTGGDRRMIPPLSELYKKHIIYAQ